MKLQQTRNGRLIEIIHVRLPEDPLMILSGKNLI